ncbi:lysozyme inhibitor LprI family protein [Pseudomonas viridiflava]|uniref:lysozyme inhibitor LprI family protein n=1 Tax=Pseudomonas viridiflava TaxID=33069 RepID=UPI002EC18246|nr:lysozyme inhibitor LprI family protein [Pseudomonas viridiflava]
MVSLALSNALFAGLCILSLTGAAFADSDCNVNEISNPDIITCTQASYAKLDKVLNAQYNSLLSELDSPSKSELLSTQKAWVTLKEEYCDDLKHSGAESPVEIISCKTQFTSFRLSELIYLHTGVVGDGFYKAVSMVNNNVTSFDYAKAFEYVSGDSDFGALWKDYAGKNCDMTNKLYGESLKGCMARMRFQTPIY